MHCSKVSGGYIMKILVISDTHGDTKKAEQAIRKTGEQTWSSISETIPGMQKLSGMFPGISLNI